ncbi:D-isomer specific 2-hydroxyacid dehydrogenase [Dipodascopsis tothii]|uniref:D-isomer specific 2-hydroxyacid dehydrogenase n=1 Tax=Dipodascopsis tothii TaxID=44089 RepID=UPI0034CD7E6A
MDQTEQERAQKAAADKQDGPKVAVFSTKKYDREFLVPAFEQCGHQVTFFQSQLNDETLLLAEGFTAVCLFVNDDLTAKGVAHLAAKGLRFVLLRCAGFNNVDVAAAAAAGVQVARVPSYSPYAIAEFAVGLMLMLNRKLHKAYTRVRSGNFSLEGLTGFNMHGKTVGVVGTGKIGMLTGRICHGFGCRVLCYDPYPNEAGAAEAGMAYVPLDELYAQAEIITLHCPLVESTKYMINAESLAKMKPDVMLINTSRGGLVDTVALIRALKARRIGAVGMDVYENESGLYFEDTSDDIMQDDIFSRLLTFHNVCITGHQAFLTREALENIASATADNLRLLLAGAECANVVRA